MTSAETDPARFVAVKRKTVSDVGAVARVLVPVTSPMGDKFKVTFVPVTTQDNETLSPMVNVVLLELKELITGGETTVQTVYIGEDKFENCPSD